jgi:Rrf2 family iron-sulfur cluster assembly transcriptional regulator
MRLSTRSRYGTRLLLDMAQHYQAGPVNLSQVAQRQGISVKYLEQIAIPLKKAKIIKSVRGPKGGHLLTRPPNEINLAEVVGLLEAGETLVECAEQPGVCDRSDCCATRLIWQEAAQAMYDKLRTISLADLVKKSAALG